MTIETLLAWVAANPDRAKAAKKRAPSQSRDAVASRMKRWRQDNPERAALAAERGRAVRLEAQRRWRQKNKARMRANWAAYDAQKRMAMPSWVDREALKAVYLACPDGLEVDHIVPLRGRFVSGLHVPWNLQYLEPTANKSKGNKC